MSGIEKKKDDPSGTPKEEQNRKQPVQTQESKSEDFTVKATTPEQSSHKPKLTVLEAHGYQVCKTVGYGSYAVVKEATSERHAMKVAIKIISKRRAPRDYIFKFLPREIEVVKHLKHPNLVTFFQSIETNNRVYLIMELSTNGDLLDVIKKNGRIPERQAGIWFHQMVVGIEHMHDQGIVHRDLKCENVLLDSSNNIKITDFGFSRAGMLPVGGKAILSETFCGSYAYAAPEILTGTPYEPQKSDIWSMGVILFTMLFGRLPFDDSNHKQLLRQVHKDVVFPPKYEKEISEECRNFIRQNLLVSSKKRATLDNIKSVPWYQKIAKPQQKTPAQTSDKSKSIPGESSKSQTAKKAQTSSKPD